MVMVFTNRHDMFITVTHCSDDMGFISVSACGILLTLILLHYS